jgi:hypothetical protein
MKMRIRTTRKRLDRNEATRPKNPWTKFMIAVALTNSSEKYSRAGNAPRLERRDPAVEAKLEPGSRRSADFPGNRRPTGSREG